MIVDVIDTYYSYVTGKMAQADSTQQFAGVVQARDWPLTPPIEGALYLLYIQAIPLRGGGESQIFYRFVVQWSWILIGTDIQSSTLAQNRGDRYRKDAKIQENLRQANFASFCVKKSYAVNGQTVTGTTFDPIESIWWSHLRFAPKQNPNSGLIYGAAGVDIYGYESVDAVIEAAA